MRATCPDTNADLGDRKKRRVDSSASSPPGRTYSSWAVAPRLTSLPSARTRPSSARWAMAWGGWWQSSGGVPSTITRPQLATRRIVGCRKAQACSSWSLDSIPEASNTSALKRWPSVAASGFQIAASRLASAAALRSSASIGVSTWACTEARTLASPEASREPAAAPKSTGPEITGCPGR